MSDHATGHGEVRWIPVGELINWSDDPAGPDTDDVLVKPACASAVPLFCVLHQVRVDDLAAHVAGPGGCAIIRDCPQHGPEAKR